MNPLEYQHFYERNLPHFQPPGAILFVTFRLAGSLPRNLLQQWSAEKIRLLKSLELIVDDRAREQQKLTLQREWFRRSEIQLHKESHGPLWLKDESVARVVSDALRFMDGKVFALEAYCLMANHVHGVFAPLVATESSGLQKRRAKNERGNSDDCAIKSTNVKNEYHSLASIMHSLKGFTASKANKLLGRRGAFWESETFDHVVRDEEELNRIVKYVLNNPVKAGLVDTWEEWPHSYWRR